MSKTQVVYKKRIIETLEELPESKLKEVLDSSDSKVEAMERLGISKYIFTSNLQFRDISFSPKTKHNSLIKNLTKRDIKRIAQLSIIDPRIEKAIKNRRQ